MKKLVAWVLALFLCAVTSVGATWAYVVNNEEDTNVRTVGRVIIEQLEFERADPATEGDAVRIQRFHNNKPLLPGVYPKGFDFAAEDSWVAWDAIGKEGYTSDIWNPEKVRNVLDKMVFVRNEGNRDAYVRTVFGFETAADWSFSDFQSKIRLNRNTADWSWEWLEQPVTIGEGIYYVGIATYGSVLTPGSVSEISLSQILLDKTATHEDLDKLGGTYQVLVYSQAVQTDGFSDPETALDESFGAIDDSQVPFPDDKPDFGVLMQNAVRYLNADGETDISALVTAVVYGTFEEYPHIPLRNDGTLVATGDGAETFAYYVQNDQGEYTVYFLSDGVIYAPADCTGMFENLSVLTTVDTSNLDVSRVEVMDRMFYNCGKLETVDVSTWDTSSVTSTNDMFYCCVKLSELNVSDWDVSNVTSMSGMFDMYGNGKKNVVLTYLDVSNWDVSNVTDMSRLFLGCEKLDNLELGNWDVSNVTNLYRALGNLRSLTIWDIEHWDVSSCTTLEDTFVNCEKIKSLDLSAWDVSNVTNMQGTFTSLISCTELNLSGWDTSKVTNMLQTFWNCPSMVNVIGLSDWDTSSVTTFRGIFGSCARDGQQWHLDLSSWDTSSATNMYMMFYMTKGLVIEGMEHWDTSNVTNAYAMFYNNTTLTELDLSSWDTSRLSNAAYMFAKCSNLETIYVSDLWTNAGITSSSNMFSGCGKLVGGAGTKVSNTGATYARLDLPAVTDDEGNVITPAVPGYLTHIKDKL